VYSSRFGAEFRFSAGFGNTPQLHAIRCARPERGTEVTKHELFDCRSMMSVPVAAHTKRPLEPSSGGAADAETAAHHDRLLARIRDRSAVVTVCGMGYVGL